MSQRHLIDVTELIVRKPVGDVTSDLIRAHSFHGALHLQEIIKRNCEVRHDRRDRRGFNALYGRRNLAGICRGHRLDVVVLQNDGIAFCVTEDAHVANLFLLGCRAHGHQAALDGFAIHKQLCGVIRVRFDVADEDLRVGLLQAHFSAKLRDCLVFHIASLQINKRLDI